MAGDDIQKALQALFIDSNEFYYQKIEPISGFLKQNNHRSDVFHSWKNQFHHENLGALVIGLENEVRFLNNIVSSLKKNPDSLKNKETLRDFSDILVNPTSIRKDLRVMFDNDEGIYIDEKTNNDNITRYLIFVDKAKKETPSNYSYQTVLTATMIDKFNSREDPDNFFPIHQKFREFDIGKLFIQYHSLLKKHLSPKKRLGKFVNNLSSLKQRKIPTLKQAFKENINQIQLSKGKGYKKLINQPKKISDWGTKDFVNKFNLLRNQYFKENSALENFNILSVLWDYNQIYFSQYNIKKIHFSDIKGYTQQKKEFKEQVKRFSNKKLINHIVLTGPPGTGKTSLVLAAANSYKKVKFLFLDKLLSDSLQVEKLPKILSSLEEYDNQFFVYADDKKYDDLSTIWDSIRSLIEGTQYFSHNIKLLLSTNHWDKFPLSFRTRFGTVIDMSLPDKRVQKSIAKYYKNKYSVDESITDILEEAEKSSQGSISGRTIEKVCEKWGLYTPEILTKKAYKKTPEILTKKAYKKSSEPDDILF